MICYRQTRGLLNCTRWRSAPLRRVLPSFALPRSPLNPSSGEALAYRPLATGAAAFKSYDDVFSKHIQEYYQESDDEKYIDKTMRNDVEQIRENELLVAKYLQMIAHDPFVEPGNFLKMFHLVALTNYPLMQLKIDHPQEYSKIPLLGMNCIKRMNFKELGALAKCLSELRQQKLQMINSLRNMIVNECADRVRNAKSLDNAIDYFDVCFEIFDEAFADNPIYDTFTNFFLQHLEEASADHLVRIMHYSSLRNRSSSPELVENALQRVSQVADEMSFIQCVIIANSVVKSGMDLNANAPFLPRLSSLLADLVEEEDSEYTSLQVTGVLKVVECFRMSRYKDDQVVRNIEQFVTIVNPNLLDCKSITTLLAFFASCRYNPVIFAHLEALLIREVDTDSSQLSIPSLARVLWSFSSTGHQCSQRMLDIANTDLRMHVQLTGVRGNLPKVADALLSLNMMGGADLALCREVMALADQRTTSYQGSVKRKLTSRLQSLAWGLSIEHPHAFSTDAFPDVELGGQTQQRPQLQLLTQLLAERCGGALSCRLQVPVPALPSASAYICVGEAGDSPSAQLGSAESSGLSSADESELNSAGTLVECVKRLGGRVFVEVLDGYSTVKCVCEDGGESRQPTGAMKYKLKLMDKLNIKYVVVDGYALNEENCLRLLSDCLNRKENCSSK